MVNSKTNPKGVYDMSEMQYIQQRLVAPQFFIQAQELNPKKV
jgi:hypothetical protein